MEQVKPIISIRGLQKKFGSKAVVNNVSFDIHPGEVIALVGENGAGKSTLKNMLCGLLKPTEGKILVNNVEVPHINGFEHGICAVHQELSLFQSLTVAENICIVDLPKKYGAIDLKKVKETATTQLSFLGAEIDPSTPVENLGMGQQQMVEIAKALLYANKFLILDEPTTSLTIPERKRLFDLVKKLKESGLAILLVSHFMNEIFENCDKFVCLRDGEQVGQGNLNEISQKNLEEMMVGRSISESQIEILPPSDEEIIRVENFSSYEFNNISFSVKKGEILGFQGLVGAGRTEVMEGLYGIRKSTGSIVIGGEEVKKPTPKKMKDLGVSFVTEDRKRNGNFGIRSVRENITVGAITKFVDRSVKGFGFKNERAKAQEVVVDMNVATPHIESKITSLSGGNQQKVILGRWLAPDPKIIILDEPTKGVDIGARFEIHNKIAEFAKKGMAVILVSSDLPELLDLSHRIVVMRKGHIVGEVSREEFDSVKIISMAVSD